VDPRLTRRGDNSLFLDLGHDLLLGIEQRIRASIDIQIQSQTQGTQNLLAQLADDSEMRNYKIQQRLKA